MRTTRKVNALQLKEAREIGEPFVREYEENDYCELEGTNDRDRLNKLGQLEDIEDDFGFDLRLLPKLLQIKKNDKLYCNDGGIVEVEVTDNALLNGNLMVFTEYVVSGICYTPVLHYRDYGKDWALTKEELL